MEVLVKLGREFVQALLNRRGIAHVGDIYAEGAESVEAVVSPGRDVPISTSVALADALPQFP